MIIGDFVIQFGAAGAPQLVTIAEQFYTAMPVGFGAVTQARWRSHPITVNGIAYTLYPGIDSDGRCDCWVYAAYREAATANVDGGENRQYATVDLQISLLGVAQSLFGGGTTYTYDHQRATWLRWQTAAMAWNTSTAFVNAKITEGTFLRHDSKNVFGSLETIPFAIPTTAGYQPFKTFCDISQTSYIGDQPRSSPQGAERSAIGPVHEWQARLVSEIGTNSNPAWLTPTTLQILKDLAETAAQFPHASGLVDPLTNRLLDPSVKPHCTHSNPTAWYSATGIPQPGMASGGPFKFDGAYDNSHPFNKISFHSYHLSKDPFHLLQVQGQAVAALAFQSLYGNPRGSDGKTLMLGSDQERGVWWGLQTLFQAWHATPAGTMPKPFRDKLWFAGAINNSLAFLRDRLMGSTNHLEAGVVGEAMRYWRITSNLGTYGAEVRASHFQEDYGHIVLAQALLLGYTAARDVAEWHVMNIQRRLELGGSWFLNDYDLETNNGFSGYAFGPSTGTLPFSDAATFKSWYPRKPMYSESPVTSGFWRQQYGRDTYLFLGALNITKEAAVRGLLTLGFDAAAQETALRARFVAPFTSVTTGNPLNYGMHAKQYFNYQGTAFMTAPADNYSVGSGLPMYIGRAAPATVGYAVFTDSFTTVPAPTDLGGNPIGWSVYNNKPMQMELHGSSGQSYANGLQYRVPVTGRMVPPAYTSINHSATPNAPAYNEYGFSLVSAGDDTALGRFAKLRPIDEYGTYPGNGQIRESFFSGFWHATTGDMTFVTARRLDAMWQWGLANLAGNFDFTRASISGGSMGADACFTYGIRRPQWFAAVYSDRGRWRYAGTGTSVFVPDWTSNIQVLSSTSIPNVAPEDGGGKFEDYQNGIAWVSNTANKLPWIGWGMGTADPNYTMTDHYAALQALRARKSGHCFVWSGAGHETTTIGRLYASYPPGTFTVGKSYPYFSGHSLDKNPLVDAAGGINEGLTFRNVVDTTGGWSCEVTSVVSACTVNVEPCNPVAFKTAVIAKLVTIPAANSWVSVVFP